MGTSLGFDVWDLMHGGTGLGFGAWVQVQNIMRGYMDWVHAYIWHGGTGPLAQDLTRGYRPRILHGGTGLGFGAWVHAYIWRGGTGPGFDGEYRPMIWLICCAGSCASSQPEPGCVLSRGEAGHTGVYQVCGGIRPLSAGGR